MIGLPTQNFDPSGATMPRRTLGAIPPERKLTLLQSRREMFVTNLTQLQADIEALDKEIAETQAKITPPPVTEAKKVLKKKSDVDTTNG